MPGTDSTHARRAAATEGLTEEQFTEWLEAAVKPRPWPKYFHMSETMADLAEAGICPFDGFRWKKVEPGVWRLEDED